MTLPSFEDTSDFDDAERGKIADIPSEPVLGAGGNVVWDPHRYDFLTGECPPTVHPSLWRQSRLAAIGGLFEVVDGIYQVRQYDLSNMSFIEGDEGVIVVDTLTATETAAAALALYREHRGNRPVTGVVITHSHADHYGGMAAVIEEGVPVFAPEGLVEHAVSENV